MWSRVSIEFWREPEERRREETQFERERFIEEAISVVMRLLVPILMN